MRWRLPALAVAGFLLPPALLVPAAAPGTATAPGGLNIDPAQIPTWSTDDLKFFLHGSMGTEIVPEKVLHAFIAVYPDLFPKEDLSNLGLLPDPDFGWPIGFSRREVKLLGGLPAVGINCASCHVAQITNRNATRTRCLLGATSHFDVEAFFGAVLVSTFRTADPANMKKFLGAYCPLGFRSIDKAQVEILWTQQQEKIAAAMKENASGTAGLEHPTDFQEISWPNNKNGQPDLAALAVTMLRLFHNMRAALHVPDQPPEKAPPASGPGRNDAFGLLAAGLLNLPQPYAPSKFGLVWNVDKRHWVHWDGNTNSPLARNLLASLGLGAPSHGRKAELDFARLKRQTDLSEVIHAPHYPFAIDPEAAKRGAKNFDTNCASCHTGPESDQRLYSLKEIGTDPHRAELFTVRQADAFNKYLAELELEGYAPPKEFGVRSTGKYFAPTLKGVWARSPYLHNGSVRTMQELLTAPEKRPPEFHRGSKKFDEASMGYTDEGAYVLVTSTEGNSNSGHNYGSDLSAAEKRDLIEYLKTL